jgi:hypothetical protein
MLKKKDAPQIKKIPKPQFPVQRKLGVSLEDAS